MDTIIGKWKSIIISELASEDLRFSDLQKRIPQISRTMLTNNLKQLEKEGIVHREVHQQVPPKVVYSMTDYGATLKPILQDLNQWGEEFIKRQNEGI
ncbi:winged helix-turn-helix transcriptional regulator [Geomicrobium sediminis]|uniref:winged helix-turn-helix transcriptional regulator n=1 Tax=Geomicrobium sediminis TaxID=1347788 RepID=UPI003B82F9CD